LPIAPASLSVRVGGDRVEVHSGGADTASFFDALLLLRGMGPGGDADVQLTTYRLLEQRGSLVMNPLGALLAAQDKLETSARLTTAGVPTPPVAVVQEEADIDDALRFLGGAVAKPQWGSLGEGVEALPAGNRGRTRAAELLRAQGSLHLQGYVDHGGRDIRAFVVGGQVVAAMERSAPEGELRTNLQIGGTARTIELEPAIQRIAVCATQVLGLDWAGVDIAMGPWGPTVIEVNGSPGWDGLHRTTGKDMGVAIAMHAARRALERIEHGARTGG
jgi:ribosomal protein S6--L-glutamate ligase